MTTETFPSPPPSEPLPNWLARRSRNAIRRRTFLGVVASATFVAALLTLIFIPHRARRAARAIAPRSGEWPDTARYLAAASRSRDRLRGADAALVTARARNARRAVVPTPIDTLSLALRARRDSLTVANAKLGTLLQRAERAPLLGSYRALGEAPELAGDARIRVLLDSLAEIERSREAFDALGGVDPLFVSLTSRAAELGRRIRDIATERRAAIRAELEPLRAAVVVPRPVAAPIDTARLVAARDSALEAAVRADAAVDRARRTSAQLAERAARARDVEAIAASPPAMLAASLVLGLAAGFMAALLVEVRRPRIADAYEAEREAGVPVIAHLRDEERPPGWTRRRADREVSPVIEQSSDAYRQLYLSVADAASSLRLIGVVSEEPAVAATVASNLAATAAYQARSVLLVDTDFLVRTISGALRLAPAPGMAEVLAGEVEWPEAIAVALVGRDRTIDVVPAGARSDAQMLLGDGETLRAAITRLGRRYDTVVVNVPWSRETSLPAIVRGVPEVLVLVRTGRTTAQGLRRLLRTLGEAGARLRGLVCWERDDPEVPLLYEPRAVQFPLFPRATRARTETVGAEPGSA